LDFCSLLGVGAPGFFSSCFAFFAGGAEAVVVFIAALGAAEELFLLAVFLTGIFFSCDLSFYFLQIIEGGANGFH
jgi:hypothetical protein